MDRQADGYTDGWTDRLVDDKANSNRKKSVTHPSLFKSDTARAAPK